MKKKILGIVMVTVMVLGMAGCGKTDSETVTVGISQFAEHGSLDNCREGFLKGLEEEGFKEGQNLKVEVKNAQADGGTANQIATQLVSEKVDLICSIATPSAQSAYNAAKDSDIPVVYTAITDPVMASLANEDGTSVGNVTGTSDMLPVEEQLKTIREIMPEAKTIGILYTTSEVNSESAIKVYKSLVDKYGFKLETVGISETSEIPLATDNILEKVDCITNLTDNTIVSSLPLILDKANKKGIPVFGSEIEQVKLGCVAAQGLDYVKLGIQTGKMAAQILKGEKKAQDINYVTIDKSDLYVNTKAAENLGINIPQEVTDRALETFDQIG